MSQALSCFIENCEFCSTINPEICLNCNPNYVRDPYEGCRLSADLSPSPWRIENCISSENSLCLECLEGYFLSSNHCEPICESENCKCFSPEICLHTIRSLNCDDENCISCNEGTGKCSKCNDGYGVSYTYTCEICYKENCKSCDGDYTSCDTCIDGYGKDYTNSCIRCDEVDCKNCNDNNYVCIECNDHYGLTSHSSCVPCNSYYCLDCKDDYMKCIALPRRVWL